MVGAALLLLSTSACASGEAGDPARSASAAAIVTAPAVAPYIDIVSGTVDVDEVVEKTGQKDFTLAFALADSTGSCTATWGGAKALTDTGVQEEILKIGTLGGRVIVSTGGATGSYLESVCDADELATQYAAVLDASSTNYLDVDIEQSIAPATVTEALATLQRQRGTAISLTVPVAGTVQGLTDASIALLRSAKDAGLTVTVNAMTMNFSADGDWGTAMTTATDAVHADVAAVWTELDDAAVYAMLGVTPMIGVNDTGPVTEISDARTILAYAAEKGLGSVRFWSVNRDNNGCADGTVQSTCSGIKQSAYEFTSLFADYDS